MDLKKKKINVKKNIFSKKIDLKKDAYYELNI